MKEFTQKFIMEFERELFVKINLETSSAIYMYDSFQNAFKYLQTNAKIKDFVIFIRRNKKRISTEKFDKVVLVCDRSDIYKSKKYKRKRKINIIKCDCSWQITVQHYKALKKWEINVNTKRHNHDAIEIASHTVHRKDEMTNEVRKQIEDSI